MQTFELITPGNLSDAIQAQATSQTAQQGAQVRFIAGGTNLVDYMKLNVETPRQAGRYQWLAARQDRTRRKQVALNIGALARNSEVAHHHLR